MFFRLNQFCKQIYSIHQYNSLFIPNCADDDVINFYLNILGGT